MPHSRASPASSLPASSTTEKTAASSLGSPTAYGDAADPGETGRHGRESAWERIATSSYSSVCRIATSASARARSAIFPARNIGRSYHYAERGAVPAPLPRISTPRGDNARVASSASSASSAADAARRIGIRLAALAQDGLTFAANDYEVDRYRQVGELAAELLAVLSGRPAEELAIELGRDSGYATPKVDVRGAVFDEDERVLLMQEKTDGRWSLPGGWADPGEAPSTAATREILEETGYACSAVKLIACWDRELQGNPPPLPVHVYKLFFLCRRTGPVQPP